MGCLDADLGLDLDVVAEFDAGCKNRTGKIVNEDGAGSDQRLRVALVLL